VSLYKHRQWEEKIECEWVSGNVYSYVCLIRVLLIWRAKENEESIVINWTNSSWWERKRHWQRMLLRWYDQRSSIVRSIAVRSSVHTYPIIEITVALNAHRVSPVHGNRLRVLTTSSGTAINFFLVLMNMKPYTSKQSINIIAHFHLDI
jgi:hypothetical protein